MEKSDLALLNVLPGSRTAELLAALQAWGIATWTLDGAGAQDATAFFAAAGRDLPGPFRVRPVADWDAFSDSLWELAAVAEVDESAFVWTHAEALLLASAGDFLQAGITLNTLARRLANPASPAATPKLMYIFVLGDAPNFGA